jgi:hypothetical protein
MKNQKEIQILLKTFETKRNNLLKRLYLPPYEDEKDSYLRQIERLDTQIKTLEWVLQIDKNNPERISLGNQLKWNFLLKLFKK